MPQITVRDFNLPSTVECGQLFTYARSNEWYYITRNQRLFAVRQAGGKLEYRGTEGGFIRWFFRLDDDLPGIRRLLEKDPIITRAFASSMGLRLVRLDLWEAILSFLCSQACNIPRIRRVLRNIAEAWGKRLELDGFVSHSLPRPEGIPSEAKLRAAGVGFRAGYICRAAEAMDDVLLERLQELGYPSAREKLLSLPGVGPKIADCICLFALGFLQAFPVDTWIRRMMHEFYFPRSNPKDGEITRFAGEYFGEYAGYAQQYLYAFYRGCPPERWKAAARDGRIHFDSRQSP